MPGDGPFLWLNEDAPDAGFRRLPRGGMCVSAFLFLRRGRELLLGKYAPHPAWPALAGLDPDRVARHGKGWTIPASHLKYGEDPRAAGQRIAEEVLGLRGLALGEPRIETEYADWARVTGWHYDIWCFVDAAAPPTLEVARPAWYADLAWHDPRTMPVHAWARGHEDIAARWLAKAQW